MMGVRNSSPNETFPITRLRARFGTPGLIFVMSEAKAIMSMVAKINPGMKRYRLPRKVLLNLFFRDTAFYPPIFIH